MVFELDCVSVRHKDRLILSEVTACFSPGQVQVIIGPNGAGKSTLLNCLSGVVVPFSGRVSYGGCDISKWSAHQLSMLRAHLGQQSAYGLHFSARELIAMGRYPFCGGRLSACDEEIIQEVVRLTDTAHLLSRVARTLSGGELQRVHVARALVQCYSRRVVGAPEEPARLLLLDEPLNSLDLSFQHKFLKCLRLLGHAGGLCVVMVLHDLNLAAAYGDVIWAMKDGKMVESGAPRELFTPALLQQLYGVPFSVFSFSSSLHVACRDAEVATERVHGHAPCVT